jgi:hypothetical protein
MLAGARVSVARYFAPLRHVGHEAWGHLQPHNCMYLTLLCLTIPELTVLLNIYY